MPQLIANDRTGAPERGADTLRGYDHTRFSNSHEYAEFVQQAAFYYDQMSELRKKWVRDIDYYMRRQLNDTVVYNGLQMTVKDYMEMKGVPAISNDIISDKIITMKGLARQQYMSPVIKAVDSAEKNYVDLFSEFLRQNDNNNEMSEKNAEQFERDLCLGFIASKAVWAFREGREDVFVDIVDPFKIAVPTWEKKDLSDIEFIAEAHDLTWPQLLRAFYRSPEDEKKLKNIYIANKTTETIQGYNDTGMSQTDHLDDFYHSSTVGKYRVIEIWKKEYNRAIWFHDWLNAEVGFRPLQDAEAIKAENERRRQNNIKKDVNGVPLLDEAGQMQYYEDPALYDDPNADETKLIYTENRIDELWYYRFVSPNGYLLAEGVSPYKVLRDGYSFYFHPYTFLAYGFMNEICSFEDRLIDKQRQFNHDNIMIDFVLMNSAKGVLAIDEASLTEKMSIEDIAENFVKVDGMILYTSKKGGNIPQSIQNKSLPAGIDLVMQRDKQLVTDQSGIQPAMQGVHHNTSGRQYQIEKESAATSVADYLISFYHFQKQQAKKQMWEIQQFYDAKRSVQISGEDVYTYYNPETMRDIAFDTAMALDVSSATVRESMRDLALQAYKTGEIDFGQMLDSADFGDTNKLKKHWEEYKQRKAQEAAMTGQAPQAAAPAPEEAAAHIMTDETAGTGGPSAR